VLMPVLLYTAGGTVRAVSDQTAVGSSHQPLLRSLNTLLITALLLSSRMRRSSASYSALSSARRRSMAAQVMSAYP
jgi:hypothetical protein